MLILSNITLHFRDKNVIIIPVAVDTFQSDIMIINGDLFMSILNVEHVTHGFGARQIMNDVSFRLLSGEHVGLVGANGEGKSTFLNIITGKLMPDEGTVEWCRHITTGYLDQ